MSESKGAAFAYPRLCIAYFCQFAIWASWAGALSGYAEGILKLPGWQIASLYSAIPLGAVIGPLFIGPLADRFFAAQKVMGLLHLIGGAALLACGYLCSTNQVSFGVIMGLMLLSGICYMPTMGLINSVVFKNLPKPNMGPYVFVFGTIGWIVSCLLIAAFFGGEKTPNFFYVGGGFGVFLAFYCFTLPNTPPKGAPAPGEKSDALGLGALKLFKDPVFALFVFCVFFASIPACGFYFPAQVPYLSQQGYPSPVALTTVNQFSELIFMTALPICVVLIGLKPVLLLGMFAWFARYIFFALPGYGIAPDYNFVFSVIGLLFHGFSYSFLYVAAYMYADKKAPDNLKASVQSLMVFLLLGVGQVTGSFMYGGISEMYPAKFPGMTIAASQVEITSGEPSEKFDSFDVPIPVWNESEDSWVRYLDLAAQAKKWMGVKDDASGRSVDLGQLLAGQALTPALIETMDPARLVQDGVKINDPKDKKKELTLTITYTREDLKKLGSTISGKEDFSLNRKDWLAAQARDWKMIFTIPAVFIGVFFLIFLFFGKNPGKDEKEPEGENATVE